MHLVQTELFLGFSNRAGRLPVQLLAMAAAAKLLVVQASQKADLLTAVQTA
jgi:hypothetical protein